MSFNIFIYMLFVSLLSVESAPIINFTQLWSKSNLTYSIIKPSKTLPANEIQAVFSYAFNQLSPVIYKSFEEQVFNSPSDNVNSLSNPPDIKIYFQSLDSSNSVGHVISRSSSDSIYFDDNEKWRKYNPGEVVDPEQRDITWGVMHEIRNLFQINNVTNANLIFLDPSYSDSNGNYVLPRFSQQNTNLMQNFG